MPQTRRKNTRLQIGKLKIIPLGGIGEIGKNMTVLEYEDTIIIIDCGLGFPDEDMLGIDLVIPDTTYLEKNKEKVKGLFLTHGHEDHIGAIPYVLRSINPPIYGTPLTLGIVKNKLEEFNLPMKPALKQVKAGDIIQCGSFSVEFIHVNHSIADACCLSIRTPVGTIVHSGDFKLDLTPIEGEVMNIGRLAQIGREGVLLLMCESTNAERPGYTPSEKTVGQSLEYIFRMHPDKRLIIATFSSNVHRVQQIINASVNHRRKVAVIGRSMLNILAAAIELGYMKVPDGTIINAAEIKNYKPEELTVITTGSQGEPMSALYRMTFNDHAQVRIGNSDVVVLSSSAIPGNEKTVGNIINELAHKGIPVIHDAALAVHVSGHACREELKLMHAILKPRFFMPVHGEYRHLLAHRDLALEMGMPSDNIMVGEIGQVLELTPKSAVWNGRVEAGSVMVDGNGIGDVGNVVLRDRWHLAQDGMVVVVATIDSYEKTLISGPDITSRGFVYIKESEALMNDVKAFTQRIILDCLEDSPQDRMTIKNQIRESLGQYLYDRVGRKPMIFPFIMNI
ncbi:MAG: ribonuclease J [Clostridia bacterium]|nr:ribonuclease J [Clostridia bacterium]